MVLRFSISSWSRGQEFVGTMEEGHGEKESMRGEQNHLLWAAQSYGLSPEYKGGSQSHGSRAQRGMSCWVLLSAQSMP